MPDLTDYELERELFGRGECSRALSASIAYARPFALAGDTAHYSRDLTVDVRHIKLEISIDPRSTMA
jgi:hypothetical protein